MLRRFVLPCMLVAAIVVMGVAAAPSSGPAAAWAKGQLADTPLARMISGCLGRLLILRSEMNVTAEQKTKIHDVLVSRRPQIAQTVKSLHDRRVALRNAVLSGKADEAQIRAAADELGKAIGDAAVKASKLRNEVAPILSAEQQQLIGKFLAENDAAVNKFLEKAMQN
jgi:Spy/CpxP family protein refolding chaperone